MLCYIILHYIDYTAKVARTAQVTGGGSIRAAQVRA